MKRETDSRRGMILINVLFVVAVAATVVMLMVTSQDVAVDRTLRLRQASQAGAYARAGELSAVTALRRDAIQAPGADHFRETWAQVQDDDVQIAGGRFSLKVEDAQSRFNLNSELARSPVGHDRLARILGALGLSPDLAVPITTYVRVAGPLSSLSDLQIIGMSPADIATLSQMVTALPGDTGININTADERLLAVLFDSPVTARLLMTTRNQRGYVTPNDLAALSASLPPGVGSRSDFYVVTTEVTVGETRQRMVSRLVRKRGVAGPQVAIYARQRTAAAPVQAPPQR